MGFRSGVHGAVQAQRHAACSFLGCAVYSVGGLSTTPTARPVSCSFRDRPLPTRAFLSGSMHGQLLHSTVGTYSYCGWWPVQCETLPREQGRAHRVLDVSPMWRALRRT